jgi:ABC-type Fe3+/spermidine/putrescine transport system ATPase subunit
MAISDRIAVMSTGTIRHIGTPREIYDNPKDAFTAEFIGLANLLPGKLTREKTVTLATRQELEIDGFVASGVGADVFVSIRPHNIKMETERQGRRNELVGVVEKVSYLGDRVDYRVLLGENALRVQTQPERAYAAGTQVSLLLPPDKITVIPAHEQGSALGAARRAGSETPEGRSSHDGP